MNENIVKDIFPTDNICRVCLGTENLGPMSNEHLKLYINLINEMVYNEYNMKICMACKWTLQKFTKFKHQCWTANNFLKAAFMDQKLPAQYNKLKSSHNIKHTTILINSYTPTDKTQHTETNTFSIHTHDNNKQEFTKQGVEDDKQTYNIKDDNMECEYDLENDCFNDNEMIYDTLDEDDVPLVLISKKTKKRKKKKFKDLDQPNDLPAQELEVKHETDGATEAKPKKKTKVLREGFTSRMVQETNEYIVIKLTKEQVLQEMAERSKTEAYLSSRFRCEKCVKGFNFQDVFDTHMEKHVQKSGCLTCDICEQRCAGAVSLRGHMKSHTTKYQCRVCGCVRASRQHLLEHHALHAAAAPLYCCLQCGFTASKRTVMQRHARSHGREPRACAVCGKLFADKHSLRLHMARHDKASRYACARCPRSFLYPSQLRVHAARHDHSDLYCVECDVRFKCAETLRVHFKNSKKHKDPTAPKLACAECPLSFHSAAALASHRSAAHLARKHACGRCRRLYSTRSALRSHEWRAHERGAQPCTGCGLQFERKTMLKKHLQAGPCGDTNKKEELPQYENKMEV